MQYRHELKFLVSASQLEQIRGRLSPIMGKDAHQEGDHYTIRSLYFDDLFDSCLEEVRSGVDNRRKYRLRLYNGDTSLIRLEKKCKLRGMTRKISEAVTPDQCLEYLEGYPAEGKGDLTQELYCQALRSGMRPKCIVEYERSAFIEEIGNVRITFDTDIRGSLLTEQFLDPVCHDFTYALPLGLHILEVKFDEFLPEYILQALDLNCLNRTSFSKYVYVRDTAI